MKKLFTVLLALTLVLASFSVAFADNTHTVDNLSEAAQNPKEIPVEIIIEGTTGQSIVYNVEIEWESLTFKYTKSADVWQPSSHTYSEGGAWLSNDFARDIIVTNHSNTAVKLNAGFNNVDVKDYVFVDGLSLTLTAVQGDNSLARLDFNNPMILANADSEGIRGSENAIKTNLANTIIMTATLSANDPDNLANGTYNANLIVQLSTTN